ncbi:hypothetical protein KW801_00820 [Candidatus Saccharibacteria bacterium]|nr:hypothetical protein [Candidatus Saccharibacteria bacterium]
MMAGTIKNILRKLILRNHRVYRIISDLKRLLKNLKPGSLLELNSVSKQYRQNSLNLNQVSRLTGASAAIVVHLYYTDSWPSFRESIKNYPDPFDLFITLPMHNSGYKPEIMKDYKSAYVFEVPNRGRDVLPFLQIASHLEKLGYEYVLKMHSKKSPHRKDGNKWFAQIVSSLLPKDKKIMDELIMVLKDKKTGIVGPKGQYISLTVNFPANGPRIAEALSNIYYPKITDKLIRNRKQHGFFAGTMFWARLDALRPILDRKFKINRFDPERGQIDATFAHALERVFCLVPQIEMRDLYEIGTRSIKKIDYKTTNIPNWSEVYIGPKPERKRRPKS